jgi:hypothetical protein
MNNLLYSVTDHDVKHYNLLLQLGFVHKSYPILSFVKKALEP